MGWGKERGKREMVWAGKRKRRGRERSRKKRGRKEEGEEEGERKEKENSFITDWNSKSFMEVSFIKYVFSFIQ